MSADECIFYDNINHDSTCTFCYPHLKKKKNMSEFNCDELVEGKYYWIQQQILYEWIPQDYEVTGQYGSWEPVEDKWMEPEIARYDRGDWATCGSDCGVANPSFMRVLKEAK